MISEYLNTNIIVFNKLGYNIYGIWKHRSTIVLWEDEYEAGAILSQNNKQHLQYLNIDSIKGIDQNRTRTMKNIINSNIEVEHQYKMIQHMKKNQLVEYSSQIFNLDIEEISKMNKDDLLELIIQKLANLC